MFVASAICFFIIMILRKIIFEINKLHNKIQNDRTVQHLFKL